MSAQARAFRAERGRRKARTGCARHAKPGERHADRDAPAAPQLRHWLNAAAPARMRASGTRYARCSPLGVSPVVLVGTSSSGLRSAVWAPPPSPSGAPARPWPAAAGVVVGAVGAGAGVSSLVSTRLVA